MSKERDFRIIKHIEDYGFLTIKQAHKIFFTDRRCGYDLARRRLAKLTEQGHIKSYMDYLSTNPEKIFYLKEGFKMPSKHTILIMDSYAELISIGAKPIYFKREQRWDISNRRSDGYCVFIVGEYLYELYIEVIYHIGTDKKARVGEMSKKYIEIIKSKESSNIVLEKMGDRGVNVNRVILIVSSNAKEDEIIIDDEKVISVDYRLSGFVNILT